MKEYLHERLSELKGVEDKIVLRELLEEILIPMFNESECKYDELRQRIENELPFDAGKYMIYSSLLTKDRLDGSHPFLHAMCEEDLLPPPTLAELSQQEGQRIGSVYLQADYLLCNQLSQSKQIWKASLRFGENSRLVRVRLVPAQRYCKQIGWLYQLFCFHDVPWVTLNVPYAFKMFDVELVEPLPIGEENPAQMLDQYRVECAHFTPYVTYDVFPAWNVATRTVKGEGFPTPAIDRIHFEYRFNIEDEGREHGYFACENEDILAARREDSNFIVTSRKERGLVWKLCKVIQSKTYSTDRFRFPLLSNRQENSFAGRMTAYWGTVVKTRLELERLLLSFEASKHLHFTSYRIVDGSVSGESYECNRFMVDEIRDAHHTKTMLLQFHSAVQENTLARDLMSFFVSQVQLVYPEYACVGVLI